MDKLPIYIMEPPLNLQRENKNFDIKILHSTIYISGCKGWLIGRKIENMYPNSIVLINTSKPLNCRDVLDNHTYHPIGIIAYGKGFFDTYLNPETQVIIIQFELFGGFNTAPIPAGIIPMEYNGLFSELFRQISKDSHYTNEILAIANLAAIGAKKTSEAKHCIVSDSIERNYKKPDFSLEKLCKETYMSRRKIQYILKDKNTSFLLELKTRRVKALKHMIDNANKDRKFSLSSVYNKAGFKSTTAANRDFFSVYGISISNYISTIKRS
ncbi:MAG: helix-turn-helix domain-containing protein [Vibrio sp.]